MKSATRTRGPRRRAAPATPLPTWVRIVREPAVTIEPVRIREAADVVAYLEREKGVGAEEVEVFYLLCLDSQSRVRECQEVTRGTLNASLVHPREVFRPAIAAGAAGIIVAHNHPSGDPTPSVEDRAVTRQLVAAGQLLNIPVYDHVVIGGGDKRFVSFASAGLL